MTFELRCPASVLLHGVIFHAYCSGRDIVHLHSLDVRGGGDRASASEFERNDFSRPLYAWKRSTCGMKGDRGELF